MKKIISLLALAGVVGGAQAATQSVNAGSFQYTFDDAVMQYVAGSAYGYDYVTTQMVWDNATSKSYAANFKLSFGNINFSVDDGLIANSETPRMTGTYQAAVDVKNLNGQNISSSQYQGPKEGFFETGSAQVVTYPSDAGVGFIGQSDSAYLNAWRDRVEFLNMPGIGRSGSFSSLIQVNFACTGFGGCTVADYVNGVGTSSLSLNSVHVATASITAAGELAAYQRSGSSNMYTYSYEFLGYASTPPVPEPETYAMLLAGLGLIGAIARRRKSSQA